ncbi:MAG: hydrolase [Gammaproteobacteria bacterium]|nr:hydrolase [Gammaproteobacteria bacterium]
MPFSAPWWARSPHVQTLWPHLVRRVDRPPLVRERLTLPDGDFIDCDWLCGGPDQGPLLLILHGLEGSSDSVYVRGLLHACRMRNWRAVVAHFRGCSGEPNRHARSYHCAVTDDLEAIIGHLRPRTAALSVVGYSLGGAVLLNWLAERGAGAPVKAAAAVSVPYDLHCAAKRLDQGFSRIYQYGLLRQVKRSLRRKVARYGVPQVPPLSKLSTFRLFDDAVTAPLHGFRDVDHYYTFASPLRKLHAIRVTTLLVHAVDDPFVGRECIPTAADLAASVRLETAPQGGHVGFVYGRYPWTPRYWLDERLTAFFSDALG